MSINILTAEQIRRACDPAAFPFETTAELPFADEIFGQPRAIRAIEFGIHMDAPGYNVFIVRTFRRGLSPDSGQHDLRRHCRDPAKPRRGDGARSSEEPLNIDVGWNLFALLRYGSSE